MWLSLYSGYNTHSFTLCSHGSAELGDIATNKNVAYAKVSGTGSGQDPEGVATGTGRAAAATGRAAAATLTRTLNHEYDDIYNRSEICTNANVAYQCSI